MLHSRRWLIPVFVIITIVIGLPLAYSQPVLQDTPGVNDQPDITLPAASTTPGVPVSFVPVVSDPDVGAGNMELEIDISDLDGVGGRSVAAGDYGTFTWGLGSGVTSDVAVTTLAALNTALTTFQYTPPAGFAGTARIIFEIDDQGNTGTGGVLSRTRFIDIDVCAASEAASQTACDTNNQPDISLPGALSTGINTPISFTAVVSDIDVGAGNMELEIDISDLDGVGGLSVPAGDYGTFTWGFGSGVTSDVAIETLSDLNTALINFTYTPDTGFTGTARIIFEIDDQGSSGSEFPPNVLSRTRFIDISVGAATATSTATATATATGTVDATATPTATATETLTAATATSTATATGTLVAATATATATATGTLIAATATSTATATGTLIAATATATATGTQTVTPLPPPPNCPNPLPIASVQGRILATIPAYYLPDITATTNVVIEVGTSWWIMDSEPGFYQLWIACEATPVWVEAQFVSPNFDAIWLGASLPDWK